MSLKLSLTYIYPSSNSLVAGPGEGSGGPGPSLIFGPNWGPTGQKNFFWDTPPPCSWRGWYRHHIIQCILHFVWFQIYWKKKTFNFSFSKSCKIISYLPFSDSLVSLKKIVIRGGCHIVGGSQTTHSVIKAFWVFALHQKLILSGKELVLQIHVSFSIPITEVNEFYHVSW